MLKDWRSWLLLVLLAGPFIIYMGLGGYWLFLKGWALYAFLLWMAEGVLFGYLANRWTKSRRAVLPPIDWDSPATFAEFDRQAWKLVEEESEKGDAIATDDLDDIDLYIETAKRLASRLAAHYHPLSTNPIEHVPVVEILTAMELAAEDLTELCREIPGGDMVTYAHWKRAVKASAYINKANEIYTYLLPIFQPVSGLVRLGTQKLMVQPAWRNMQQNVMRWFYKSFVNRLGFHLIELYSGRLSIGADQYRRLTRKGRKASNMEVEGPGPLTIAIAGGRDAGKTTLVVALDRAVDGDLSAVRARLESAGFEPDLANRLTDASWLEVSGYTVHAGAETARDRSTRHDAVEVAVDSDLLLLVIDGRREDVSADVKFVEDWARWYEKNPRLEVPPALAVVTFGDEISRGVNGTPNGLLTASLRTRVDAIRAALPKIVTDVVAVGLGGNPPAGVYDRLLPGLAPLLHRAERASSIRHLYHLSTRSKARRLVSQVGRQGRRLWDAVRSARNKAATKV